MTPRQLGRRAACPAGAADASSADWRAALGSGLGEAVGQHHQRLGRLLAAHAAAASRTAAAGITITASSTCSPIASTRRHGGPGLRRSGDAG